MGATAFEYSWPGARRRRLWLAAGCLLLSACGSDPAPAPAATAATPAPLLVEMPRSQTLVVSPGETERVGHIAYTANGLDADTALVFALQGDAASGFIVDGRGGISAAAPLDQISFPAQLTATLSAGSAIMASSKLRIERRAATPLTGPLPSVSVQPGQSFVVSDLSRGASVGRLDFRVQPAGTVPSFVLSGAGSEYFAVDGEGNIALAARPPADRFSYRVTLTARVSLSATAVSAALALVSSSPAPPSPVPPPAPVEPRPPLPADARVFDDGARFHLGERLSGATPLGACFIEFVASATDEGSGSCPEIHVANGLVNGTEYDIEYSLAEADESVFAIVDNLLIVKNRFSAAGRDGFDPAQRIKTVRVEGRYRGQTRASALDISMDLIFPVIGSAAQTYAPVPVDASHWLIGPLGFFVIEGSPDDRLVYRFESQPAGMDLRINDKGELVLRGVDRPLVANQRYFALVRASVPGLDIAGQPRQMISFMTQPPRLSYPESQYRLLVSPGANRAGAAVGALAVSSVPEQALVDYGITDDPGGHFYAGPGGLIYLRKPLATTTGARLRATAGGSSASAAFMVAVAEVDFTAAPVDASVTRRDVRFAALLPAGLSAAAYQWDFGDGSPMGSGATVTHSYAATGEYEVTLAVTSDAGGDERRVSHRVYPHAGDDPYKRLQWYLRQESLSPFALALANQQALFDNSGALSDLIAEEPGAMAPISRAGEDIRAIDHLEACGVLDSCRGEGVVVQVVDLGAETGHPELAGNSRLGLSRNLIAGAPDVFDPYVRPSGSVETDLPEGPLRDFLVNVNAGSSHGTSVAGIILAEDANDLGVAGIAPRAELSSYNLLSAGTIDVNQVRTFGADYDIANHSWGESGPGIEFTELSQVVKDVIEGAVQDGRGGRGAVIVKAAGNEGQPFGSAVAFGNHLSSGYDGHNAHPAIISVGGVLASGEENVRSEGGSNVLISAYWPRRCGYEAARLFVLFPASNPVGIVTTDLSGNYGVSWGEPPAFISALTTSPASFVGGRPQFLESAFGERSFSVEPLESMEDYDYCFSGTSAASPQVAGVAALVAQARPELSWRDVRAVLARTARQNAPDDTRWAENGAGLPVHPVFGFGVVNAQAAVAAARSWQLYGDEIIVRTPSPAMSFAVRDCAGSCGPEPGVAGTASFSAAVELGDRMDVIETVQAEIEMTLLSANRRNSNSLRGRLEIALEHLDSSGQLISRSVLHKRHPYLELPAIGGGSEIPDTGEYIHRWTYLSVHHLGEDAGGSWRLAVRDFVDDDSEVEIEASFIFRGR